MEWHSWVTTSSPTIFHRLDEASAEKLDDNEHGGLDTAWNGTESILQSIKRA